MTSERPRSTIIERERDEQAERRCEAIRRTSGALTGVYEPDYLERLRICVPRLELRDCCVLLAARDDGASGVLTFADRLAKAATRSLP